MMDFFEVADDLQIPEDARHDFGLLWEDSEKNFPQSVPAFLTADFIRENYPKLGCKEDSSEQLIRTAEFVLSKEKLLHFVWHLYYRTFLNTHGGQWMKNLELPETVIPQPLHSGLVWLLVALASTPLIRENYVKAGIPVEYALNQHLTIGGMNEIYKAGHNGLPGHNLRQTAWLRHAVNVRLFRIGRFEYVYEKVYFDFCPAIYENRKTGKLAVLARAGWCYDASGYRCDEWEPHQCQAVLLEDENTVQGIRLNADGTADMRGLCSLPLADWNSLYTPWTPVVTFHIPCGGGMKPELVQASMKEAAVFFKQYLHLNVPAFFCVSWILNPVWRKLLPESNITKFQRSTFAMNLPGGKGSKAGLFFIFGKDEQPETFPADNSMRRAMLEAWKQDALNCGVMFMPVKKLDQYGHPELF